jgi:hypothetical protein
MEVEQTWEKNNKVFFYLNGFKASISKKEVLRIERKIKARSDSSDNSKNTQKPPTKVTNITKKNVKRAEVNKSPKKNLNRKSHKKILNHNKKNGFRDLKWGVNLVDLDGFVEIKTDTGLEEVKEYIREHEILKLGDAYLNSIVYSFWRDQFYTVTVWTAGKTNYISLRNEAFKRFGKGQQSDQTLERYLWSDASTDRMLKFIKDTQVGMLWMRSKEIDRCYKLTKFNVPSTYLKRLRSKN